MAIAIREEQAGDLQQVFEINEHAFGRDNEAVLVQKLRSACPDCLSLVATENDQIVGHVLFTPVEIESAEGMGLGPVAVTPAKQKQGIGIQMIDLVSMHFGSAIALMLSW